MTAIVLSLGIALAVNGAFFAIAAARRTDVVTDLSYSLTFALLAVVLLLTGNNSASASKSNPRLAKQGVSVEPWIGTQSAGLSGTF